MGLFEYCLDTHLLAWDCAKESTLIGLRITAKMFLKIQFMLFSVYQVRILY